MMPSSTSLRFEGHAIVSADGMIADRDGTMPPALRSEADWRIFQQALDLSALVVLGRLGHERHPNPGRRRLVLTTGVNALEADPADRLATLWNPGGMELAAVLEDLGIASGTVAVTGGRRVFDFFLPLYTGFSLSEVGGLLLDGGVPAFSTGHPRAVLSATGMIPGPPSPIDEQAGVTLTRWRR